MLEMFYFLRKMTPHFKDLTQNEIDELMHEFDGENFFHSESDYKIEI